MRLRATVLHLFRSVCCALQHTIPYHTTPYHITPHHTIPHHTTPYHTIPYHTIPHHTTPHHTMACHAMPCHAMPCHAIPHHTIQCASQTELQHDMAWHSTTKHNVAQRSIKQFIPLRCDIAHHSKAQSGMLYPPTIQNGTVQRGTVQCVMTALPRSLHFHLLRLLISLSTPIKSSSKFLTKNA